MVMLGWTRYFILCLVFSRWQQCQAASFWMKLLVYSNEKCSIVNSKAEALHWERDMHLSAYHWLQGWQGKTIGKLSLSSALSRRAFCASVSWRPSESSWYCLHTTSGWLGAEARWAWMRIDPNVDTGLRTTRGSMWTSRLCRLRGSYAYSDACGV